MLGVDRFTRSATPRSLVRDADSRRPGRNRLARVERVVALLTCAVLLAVATTDAAIAVDSARGADAPPEGTPEVVDVEGVPEAQRDATLGSSWKSDGDVATIVLGGSEGLAVLAAASEDGYAWREVTSLPAVSDGTDLWISNSCVTSSGRYMIVVYGPRSITNSEEGFGFGATAVIVDLESGEIRELGTGYSIAYHTPGCGAGDTVTLSAHAPGSEDTLLASLAAATGEVLNKASIPGQATSAISDSGGTIYVAASGGIVRLDSTGKAETVIKTAGVTYDLAIDDAGRLAYVTYDEKTAAAWVATLEGKAKPVRIATGFVTELGIERAQSGGFYLLGESVKQEGSDATIIPLPEASFGSVISSTGHLVIDAIKPAGIAPAPAPDEAVGGDALRARIDATATQTDEVLAFDLGSYEPMSSIEALNVEDPVTGGGGSGSANTLGTGDPHDPIETERYCSVPRNDPNNQAYQPKPRQVEWAVDRAVSGQLTETRPANWRNLGMASYTPQGMFPRTTLTGGGTIPPQIVLGVLMQESNMWQASRYTQPGNTGNPLIGNFYGSITNIWEINYSKADCGYGVGQITDGMRIAGHEKPGETALPYAQQQAIALDYTANIAKAVQMLGQKWNHLKALGITINNGSASSIENWFATVWAYNTGLQPSSAAYGNGTGCSPGPSCTTADGTWGLGWFNNPANTEYPVGRSAFLQNDNASDAAIPQYWPYPEKVMGFAAWGLALVETQWTDPATRTYPTRVVSSYSLAWWNSNAQREASAAPPHHVLPNGIERLQLNSADPACTLAGLFCYWHGNATWKNCAAGECGYGNERFSYPTYNTEITSMNNPALHPDTVRSSFSPNCTAPPVTMLVVDDTTYEDARNAAECTPQSRTGSFQFTFLQADGAGSYPAKVDLHQQGGGFNGHFYFSHVRSDDEPQALMTGTWSLGQTLTAQWTRVWIHLPDYAAWSDSAAYTITYGPGQSQTRYLPQRRYANEWVPIGVFNVSGVPTVSLSNLGTVNFGVDDIAWDAVGFQLLSQEPDDFVVALGDSYASGEGADSYAPWSDHDGSTEARRNACHQSANSWIGKSEIGGTTATIAARANPSSPSSTLDFHFLACSGAESENLLPRITADPADNNVGGENYNLNGKGEPGRGQFGLVSQIDAGYLDANTTLVTLSVGGNDLRFADILARCAVPLGLDYGPPTPPGACADYVMSNDTLGVYDASLDRLDGELPDSLDRVLYQIKKRAPNALIVLVGYPIIFETGATCVWMPPSNGPWLIDISQRLADELADAADRATDATHTVLFADTQPFFTGRNLCASNSAMNALVSSFTPGDLPPGIFPGQTPFSQQSAHPNQNGTSLYSEALEDALVGYYP